VPARDKIVDLKRLLAERFPPAPASRTARLRTGLAFLDDAIEGGFPQGAITEIISPHLSAGSATFVGALIAAAQRDSYFVALIDGRDSFSPDSLTNDCLRHVLWVRCTKASEAIKAADLLLRDGNLPLVIVDLVLNAADELRKIPQPSWYRLQRLVESTSSAFVVFDRQSMVASAQLKLVLNNTWTLADLERDAISRLRIDIRRSHARSTITHAEAQVG
jgi:hypothetical protein